MDIRTKAILSVMLLITILTSAFIFMSIQQQNAHLESVIKTKKDNATFLAENLQEQVFTTYKTRIVSLATTKKEVINAFARRDREALYQVSLPFYETIKHENHYFSLMHFHLPDNSSFLRMHKPDFHGDDFAGLRPIVQEVNSTHKQLAGYEVGKAGLFYRIVQPVFDGEQYIGALEFGISHEQLVNLLQKRISPEISVAVKIESWKKVNQVAGKKVEPGEYTIFPNQSGIIDKIGANILRDQDNGRHYTVDGKTYILFSNIELLNFQKNPAAKVLVALDISEELAGARNFIIKIVLFALLLLLVSGLVLYFSFGHLLKRIVILNTCLNQSNQNLTIAKTYVDNILASMSDGLLVTTADGKITKANQAFCQMLGYSEAELLWKEFFTFLKNPRKIEEHFNNCGSEECEINKSEQQLLCKDGASVPVLFSATSLTDGDGNFIGVVCHVTDITERKKAETALREAHDQLEQRVIERTFELSEANTALKKEMAEREHAEEKIRQNVTRLKSLVDILQYPCKTIRDFLDNSLNEAATLTDSRIGFIYFYNEERQEFELNSWPKDVMQVQECAKINYQTIDHLDKTGFLSEVVRQRKPVVLNDFKAENPPKNGYPEGHADLSRFMLVPIFSNDKIVAVMGVANKKSDYDEDNVLQLNLLMNSVWKYVENKQGEIALKQEQERAQSYLDTVETMIVALDVEGNITTINRKACQILGYKADELIGQSWFAVCLPQPDGMEKMYPFFLMLVAGEISPSQECQENPVITRSSELRQIAWHSSILRDEHGRITGTLNAGEDITERKRAEKEKIILEAQLHQAQKMESIGSLAGGVAHDFNNKLSVILGYTSLANAETDPAKLQNYLDQIHKAAEQSADLTQQLLAFARKQTIAPKILDLNKTVSGILKMLGRLIGEHISLIWQPASDLWLLKIDPSQIDQILANLCVNARDSITDSGKITIETGNSIVDEKYCTQHTEILPGEYVRLAVSDNGCGMDNETQAHIFEPFFTTKEVGKGTGLGLATVFGIVKQNNGFINVYSEPGLGTTFKIYFPRYVGKSGPARKENREMPAPRGVETILLVEDELAILNMVATILAEQGYTVLQANTVAEALRLAKEHAGEISLLVTDVIMPEMNGKELAHKLQALHPRLKCLFMSGYTSDAIAHHGVLDEGVCFIQKPFSLPDLATKVREVLTHNS